MVLLRLSLLLIPGLAMAAAPVIQGVTDAAGYGPRAAPGALATLFGTGLASGTDSASTLPLPTSLDGASVSVGGTLAPILYASPGQINFQVPSSVAAGDADVVVNGPDGSSAPATLTITAQAPAIFQYGTNHAVAQNADGTINSSSNPAAAGSIITVYLTGQGAVSNPVSDGDAAPVTPISTASATSSATIGPLDAPVKFLGLTSGFAGLAQANIQVPALPNGDYPLTITVGGLLSASTVVSVSGSGNAYASPLSLVGFVPFANSDPSFIALYNNIAYVCGADNIVAVDVSNAAAPSVIGAFGSGVLNGAGDLCAVNTAGATPILIDVIGVSSSDNQSFAVYSLSNPRSPTLLTVASTPYGHMEDLSFIGTYGIVTSSYLTYYNSNAQIASQTGEFLVFDFSNPSHPLLVTNLPAPLNQTLKPWAEVVDQLYAFVATTTATGSSTVGAGQLNVYDITSPAAPTPISQVTVPQAAILTSFDFAGSTLLAAGNTTGQRNPGIPDFDFTGYLTLTSMDLTNPQLPAVVSTVTTQLQVNGTFHTAAFSNGVFAIVNKPPVTDNFGPSGLMVVDVRNRSSILLYPWQTQFGFSGIVTTNNNYLLAPTVLGLNIYKLQLGL